VREVAARCRPPRRWRVAPICGSVRSFNRPYGSGYSSPAAGSLIQGGGARAITAANLGTPVTICGGDSPPSRAYIAAARRLAGEHIEMTIPTDKKGFFNKLFWRRAA
jgi:hypothetical protein